MNKVILIGRLTKDPDVRRSQEGKAIARYTLAVDRWGKEKAADFIQCVAFDKKGEFAEQYFRKGMKIAITGRIQTGKYTNKDGQTVYTTDVIIDDQEFCESKGTHPQEAQQTDGFVSVPDDFRPPWEG
jgi:single-strand DNA-binding protein